MAVQDSNILKRFLSEYGVGLAFDNEKPNEFVFKGKRGLVELVNISSPMHTPPYAQAADLQNRIIESLQQYDFKTLSYLHFKLLIIWENFDDLTSASARQQSHTNSPDHVVNFIDKINETFLYRSIFDAVIIEYNNTYLLTRESNDFKKSVNEELGKILFSRESFMKTLHRYF